MARQKSVERRGLAGAPTELEVICGSFLCSIMAATENNLVTASWADRSKCLSEDNDRTNIRFFIIKLKERNFHDCSPFLIQKCIQSSIGRVKSVKKLRSGELLVQTTVLAIR